MSKAFTSEHTEVQPPVRPLPQGRRPITARGFEALKRSLRELSEVTRPALTAAARNDSASRAQLRAVDRKIQETATLLSLCDVIAAVGPQPTQVALGTKVTVQADDDTQTIYTLVGPDEIDVAQGRISHASPIGRALMGASVDAEITIERPKGPWTINVVAIQPADS